MNKLLAPILEIAIKESLENYESKEDSNSLEDLFMYHDNEENALVIYDDTDYVLNKVQLPDDESFNLTHTLRQVLQQAGKERLFDREYIIKPFAVSLIDKDFVVLEKLFFRDDDTMKKSDVTLWADIEKDLDAFLKKLLQ
jgi:hypothetical protein